MEEEVPRMVVKGAEVVVVEEAKGAKGVVAEEARVVAPAQPKFLTPSQSREPRGTKKGVETKQPQVLKRGSSAGRIAEMEPGEERDEKVVRMEDDGQLTNWQGKKGRKTLSTRSEGGSSPARKRRTTEALDSVAGDRAVDNNRNSLPSAGRGTDGGGSPPAPAPPRRPSERRPPWAPPSLWTLGRRGTVRGRRRRLTLMVILR